MTGSAAAQIINLASYPFLTRLYTPGDFGIFAVFTALALVFGAVSCMRNELAIQSAKPSQVVAVY